jgi:nucleoside-diphosphate-sugar epimerase
VKEGEIKHSRAAIEKAKNQLNYMPTISLSEGIAKFLRL